MVDLDFVGYPGGGSTVSSAEGPRSVESPESVTGGGDRRARPSIGCGTACGNRESILVAHETKFQSRALEAWAYRRSMSSTSFSPANQWKTPSLRALTADCAMKAWPCTTSRPSLRDRRRMKRGGWTRSSIGPMARSAIRRRSCSSPNLRRAGSPKKSPVRAQNCLVTGPTSECPLRGD